MVYSKIIPKTDQHLSESLLSNGWIKIREPKSLFTAILLSIPLMVLNAALTLFAVAPIRSWVIRLGEMMLGDGIALNITVVPIVGILGIFVYLIIHELLHAVFTPNFPKSKKTHWGISFFGGFVSTTEEITKGRFILISIVPFIVLSLAMPALFIAFNGYIAFFAILNALGSSIDILNIITITFQVPNGGRIINNGFETYFKCS
jgi:hypothetical protein